MSVLRKNIVFLVISQAATSSISVVLLIVAPRRLGAESFGEIQFALAYVGFFNLIGSLGTYQYIVKSIARDVDVLPRLVLSAIRLKLVMGGCLTCLAMGLGLTLGYSGRVLALIAIGCGGMNLSLLNEMAIAGLNGMERMARTAVWQTVQVYAASAAAFVIVLTTRSLVAYAAAFALAWAIPLVANVYSLRPLLRNVESPRRGTWRALIRGGIPIFGMSALSLIYATIDIPIVEAMAGAEVVGWYSLAYRWAALPIFITTIVVTAFLPQLSALAAESPAAFGALTNRAIKLVLIVNIPASIGLVFVSKDLVHLLYGTNYEHSIVLLQILAVFVPLAALNTVLATALVASDRHRRYLWVAAVAAVFNPLLSAVAVHLASDRYSNGAIGAAIVTVATEIFITCCVLRMRRPGVMDRTTVLFIVRCVGAACCMIPPIVLLRQAGLFVKVGAGGAAYLAVSLTIRTVSPRSLRSAIHDLRGAGEMRA